MLRRLAPRVEDDAKLARSVAAAEESGEAARAGVVCMKKVVTSLRGFARLDEADLQRADVREGLDDTLALIERERFGDVSVVKAWSEVPQIECRPKELNQVFMTLIMNALDTTPGQGTVFTLARPAKLPAQA